ncbi:hypothetical protein THIOSC15_560001 [uncultured Thiomicrorhabdus sp.]
MQGLPVGFDLPSFNVKGKKRAVGNGVPLVMGRVLARAVWNVTRLTGHGCDLAGTKKCDSSIETCDSAALVFCDAPVAEKSDSPGLQSNVTDSGKKRCLSCKRLLVTDRAKYCSDACRKRASRKRLCS